MPRCVGDLVRRGALSSEPTALAVVARMQVAAALKRVQDWTDASHVMVHTQHAFAEGSPGPRVALGTELRLSSMPRVLATIRELMHGAPPRIELDGSALFFMTEGARQLLADTSRRLARLDVALVLVGCEPFALDR